MTPQQVKYILAAQEQTLNTVLNLHAESRATKELVILMAKGSLKFPDGHTAEGYWQACFDRAFAELSKQSKDSLLKQIQ
jgi:hypothetical protein